MAAPRPQSSMDVHGERRDAVSNKCGITLNDSVQSREIVKVMEKKPGVTITYYPSMIRIDGENKLEFDMKELSEALGREIDPYDFTIEMATHYGRMVMFDDKLVFFGRLEDALPYEVGDEET
jgi:propane monooxygenase coupling protein